MGIIFHNSLSNEYVIVMWLLMAFLKATNNLLNCENNLVLYMSFQQKVSKYW